MTTEITLKSYLGVKLIKGRPMTRGEYNDYRGWIPSEGEDQNVDGYLVVYPDGYESWSPKPQFEEAYREMYLGSMNFGLAVEALKKGLRVARHGWNSKDMFLFLLPAGRVPVSAIHDPALRKVIIDCQGDAFQDEEKERHFNALATIRMWTATHEVLTGWLASQTDMLSDDWFVVK